MNKKIIILTTVTFLSVFLTLLFLLKYKQSVSTQDIKPSTESDLLKIDDSSNSLINFLAVDVSGSVKNPGVYNLEYGSRVVDALDMAGGLSTKASIEWVGQNLNLSKVLYDSEKIYIPFEWEIPLKTNIVTLNAFNNSITTSEEPKEDTSNNNSDDTGLINVNTSDLATLKSLNGIGDSYAQRIIANRPYNDIEDFAYKTEFSQNLLNKITQFIEF